MISETTRTPDTPSAAGMDEFGETASSDEARWLAVQERDASQDGSFVFAVATTGIYCRPSCPARRPKRENVRFFADPDAAERAGFRACRRCRPRETDSATVDLVRRACRLIDDWTDGPVRLAALAESLGVSKYHLQRTFRRHLGISPRAYGESLRLARLKAGLRAGDTVTGALYDAGYGSSSRLYEKASSALGMTPGAYRRGGRGARVAYAIVGCPLGRLLVAATELGACVVALGDDDAALEGQLRRELPNAELRRDDAAVRDLVDALLGELRGEGALTEAPLDVAGTAFQREVWTALRQIPIGATRTYADLARSLGRPTAARAVARACATNPVALLVPCHRVVRGDGGLGGYRWGLDRKRALLEAERERANP